MDVKPHALVLGLIDESRISMGRRLLASCITGQKTERIKKLRLNKLVHFGSLPLYDKKDALELINLLLRKKYIRYEPLPNNRYIKVLVLTKRGKAELKNPSDSITLERSFDGHYSNIKKVTQKDKTLFKNLGKVLKNLSDEQKKAVICPNKRILCIAGAGSGKTRALTRRASFLASYKSVPHDKILAITFTRKARDEMQHRLDKLIKFNNVNVHTFNSFCEKILKKREDEIYDKKYKVMSYRDKIRLIMKILEEMDMNAQSAIDLYYTDRQQRVKDKTTLFFGFVNDMFSVLDYKRNNNLSHEKLMELIDLHENSRVSRTVKDIIRKIVKYKEELGLRDYTDQIVHIIRYFKENKERIPKYSHILVDEYQDINSLQFELIELLSPDNLFVVGDPRQSIYGWRGSRIDYILDFEELYEYSAILQLSRNYRSEKQIVEACNTVIKKMKMPDLTAYRKGDDSINIIEHADKDAQSLFVGHSIKSLSISRNEIFILARTNKQLEEISKTLDKMDIKYLKKTTEKNTRKIAKEDEITLSTIHAIKGLEADVVYIIGANNRNHPCKASEHPILEVVKLNDNYDKLDEELRLFYVAMSRAKKQLVINYTGNLTNYVNEELREMLRVDKPLSKKTNYKSQGSALFNELRSWRYEKAQQKNVPPYMIFNDKTLNEICEVMPTSFEQMHEITGFGPYKVRQFGNEIVKIILNHS